MNDYQINIQVLTRDCERLARTYALNLENVLWDIKVMSMKNDWRQNLQTRIDEYAPKV